MPSAFAPCRIELLGNHTDYNDGFVLAFAGQLGVTIQGEARSDQTVNLKSEGFGEDSFSLTNIDKNVRAPWSNYVKGVLLQLQQLGAPLQGFDAQITSTLPSGVGMSSSAAVEVATLLFAQKLFGFELGDVTNPDTLAAMANICRSAENDFVGVKCGILDQIMSLSGKKDHILFLDARSHLTENIPFSSEICFVICHTGVKHALLSSKYNARRTECSEAVKILQMNKIEVQALRDISSNDIRTNAGIFVPRVFQRAMHITTENERVLEARVALFAGDYAKVGKLMVDSHESSKEAFENSTQFLDQLVELAKPIPGYIGARLMGGGFGGGTINMVYRHEAESFMNTLMQQYKEKSGKDPQAWLVEASDGAAAIAYPQPVQEAPAEEPPAQNT